MFYRKVQNERIEADAFKLMKKNPNAKIVGNVGFDKAK
jgi:hypothetical protein